MDADAHRRLQVLEGQLAGSSSAQQQLHRSHTAGDSSSSYATATGEPSSYARVHGEVSRAAGIWRRIDSVAKEQLGEVKYEKSAEGIAKVLLLLLLSVGTEGHHATQVSYAY